MIGQSGLSIDFGSETVINNPTVQSTSHIVLDQESFVDQTPAGLDTPLQVNFGAATSNAFMSITAAGLVTFVQAGYYTFRIRLNMGRVGGAGVAILLARAVLNGTQSGPSLVSRLDTAGNSQSVEFTFEGQFPAAATMIFQIMRDSAGTNAGLISAFDPTLAGWNNVASADILATRWTGITSV